MLVAIDSDLRLVTSAMSFNSLKSARKTKELHSFVKPQLDVSNKPVSAESEPQMTVHPQPPTRGEIKRAESSRPPMQVGAAETFFSSTEKSSGIDTISQNAVPRGLGAPNIDAPSSTSLSAVTDTTPPPIGSDQRKTKPVSLNGCHESLPDTVEIRESSRHGRGIYTTSAISAGMPR